MRSNKTKVIILFFACGLVFGLLAVLSPFIPRYVVWGGEGAIFLLGLFTSITVARINGWLSVIAPIWRHFIGALIITGAYPLALLAMGYGLTLYSWLYEAVAPAKWRQRSIQGDYPDMNEGFLIALIFAAILSAVLVSLTLWFITRRWDKRAFILLALAGIMTIPISIAIAMLIESPNTHLILFPVGGALFTALCGYWLQRANRLNHSPNDAA